MTDSSRAEARDAEQPPARPGDTPRESDERPRRRPLQIFAFAFAIALLALAAWITFGALPPKLLDRTRFAHTTVLDRNGVVLYESLPASGARSEWLTANEIPKVVIDATLAAEDRRFFSHHGVDPIAIGRAALQNVRALGVVEGGSTITQQVAKLLLDSRDRSLRSKAREAVLAVRLDRRMSKREILALYLNLAPYGNRIQGVARASRAYFGCDPAALTPAQAAYLAALPQRPGAFNPLRDPVAARRRQRAILVRMHEAGWLSAADLKHARAEELRFERAAHPAMAMHFVEHAIVASGDSRRIVTTLDANLQRDVTGIIKAQRENLLRHGATSIAVAVLDNRTGEWLAWEGSGDYFGTSFGGSIDGVTALRQPGSTLKPFTYALAFERGESPATVLADVPSSFSTAEEGIVYTPRNYDGSHRGPMRVRAALAGSQNVPAVAMLSKLGAPSLLRLLRLAGFTSLDKTSDYYGLGLTLGGGEVTLEQLVTAYAAFARGGAAVTPSMLHRRADFSPRAAGLQSGSETRNLFSPRTAFWISDILSDDEARAFAFGRGGSLEFPFRVAVKTGTSQSYRDNWTIGFTRDVTVGVWVGNFDRRELRGSSGVMGAAPVFHSVMLAAVKRVNGALPIGDHQPIVAPPANVESVAVCATSGMRPSPWCPASEIEWLPREAAVQFCSWHRDGRIDWPAEYRAWARENAPETIQPIAPAVRVARSVEISSPPNGATYLIDPTLRREFQTLRLTAAADHPVTWRIGSERIGTARPGERVEWPLTRGRHVVTATDTAGNRDSVTITVR